MLPLGAQNYFRGHLTREGKALLSVPPFKGGPWRSLNISSDIEEGVRQTISISDYPLHLFTAYRFGKWLVF